MKILTKTTIILRNSQGIIFSREKQHHVQRYRDELTKMLRYHTTFRGCLSKISQSKIKWFYKICFLRADNKIKNTKKSLHSPILTLIHLHKIT